MIQWQSGRKEQDFKLDENEVLLCAADITDFVSSVRDWHLSAAEQDRAKRFHYPQHAQQFVISHGLLRDILATSLNCHPRDIAYQTYEHGKPYLEGDPLHFNISHTGSIIMIALAKTACLGVDVEMVGRGKDILAIAGRYFSDAEYEQILDQQTAALQQQMFTRLWTLKEAVVKFSGRGLGQDLRSFSVNVSEQATVSLRGEDQALLSRPFLMEVPWYDAQAAVRAALACSHQPERVRALRLS